MLSDMMVFDKMVFYMMVFDLMVFDTMVFYMMVFDLMVFDTMVFYMMVFDLMVFDTYKKTHRTIPEQHLLLCSSSITPKTHHRRSTSPPHTLCRAPGPSPPTPATWCTLFWTTAVPTSARAAFVTLCSCCPTSRQQGRQPLLRGQTSPKRAQSLGQAGAGSAGGGLDCRLCGHEYATAMEWEVSILHLTRLTLGFAYRL